MGWNWFNADGIIWWYNREGLDLLGYPKEEYAGRNITEFHADKPVIEDILSRLARNETLREYPARLRCKDGSIRHVAIKSTVLFEDGEFVHTHCFTCDVTEHTKADAEFQEQARLDALAARIGKHLVESGDLAGILRRCSDAVVEGLDVAFAPIWALSEQGEVLELQTKPGINGSLNESHAPMRMSNSKIDRIIEQRKPLLTNHLVQDPNVPEREGATVQGMAAFAGYPLIVEDRPLGIPCIFSRHPLSAVTQRTMARGADQISSEPCTKTKAA